MAKGCHAVLGLIAVVAIMARLGGVQGWKESVGKVVHVEGKILCQDCTKGWNEWAKDAKPIIGAVVAVTCPDIHHRIVYHETDKTDSTGHYDISVPAVVNGKRVKLEACLVRVVSSPNPDCNLMTNFGNGKSGVKLYRPLQVSPKKVKFYMESFYFTSLVCDVTN